MMVVNRIYFQNRKKLSEKGTESVTYKIGDKVYKIYRCKFPYNEEKLDYFKTHYIDNVALLDDILRDDNGIYGYRSSFLPGKSLKEIYFLSTDSIINASIHLPKIISEMSRYKLTPSDMNGDNILLDENLGEFNFVDTYGYIIAKRINEEQLFFHTLNRINETILCTVISQNYKKDIYELLKGSIRYSKYIGEKNRPLFLYEIFSILQEALDCETIGQIRGKMLEKKKN